MRDNTTPELVAAVSAPTLTTYLMAKLEFKSETLHLWTGVNALAPTGTGDSLVDGFTFEPLVSGLAVDIGENVFTMQGSNEFVITLNIPATPSVAIAAAQIYPDEYWARSATFWRAVMVRPSDPLAQVGWLVRRIRTGTMDKVEVDGDGLSHKLTLTIESHQSAISGATSQTYLNQKLYDPNDTSQDYAVSIANGDPAPAKGVPYGYGGGGNGADDVFMGRYFLNKMLNT